MIIRDGHCKTLGLKTPTYNGDIIHFQTMRTYVSHAQIQIIGFLRLQPESIEETVATIEGAKEQKLSAWQTPCHIKPIITPPRAEHIMAALTEP